MGVMGGTAVRRMPKREVLLSLARPERFELPTYCSGGNRSIQLSYGRAAASVYIGVAGPSNLPARSEMLSRSEKEVTG